MTVPPSTARDRPSRHATAATVVVRALLLLMALDGGLGVALGRYPGWARVAALAAVLALVAAAFWRLRRPGGSTTLGFLAAAVCGWTAIEAPVRLWHEEWASGIANDLAIVLALLLAACAVLLRLGLRPLLAVPAAVLAVGIFMQVFVASYSQLPLPMHYLAGGTSGDPELGYNVLPYSKAVQFYPTNPRLYFTSLDKAGPSHWLAWQYDVIAPPPSGSRVTLLDDGGVRLEATGLSAGGSAFASWRCELWPLRAGRRHELRLRGRAAAPCDVELLLQVRDDPSQHHFRQRIELGPAWQAFTAEFTLPQDCPPLAVALHFDRAEIPVELADFSLTCEGRPVRTSAPLTRYLVEYQTNAQGFRDRDYDETPAEGAVRIVCLGDSLTWGQGVQMSDTYARVLEQRLNGNDAALRKPAYEVINCGRVAYGSGNQRVCYERQASRYRPQVVVLQVCENDFEWDPSVENLDPPLAEPFASGPDDDALSRSVPHTYWVSARQIRALARRCRQDGAALVVALFRTEAKGWAWQDYQALLERVLCGENVPVIDLGVALLRESRARTLYVHRNDRHPNELAHRIAAEEIARTLHERGLLGSAGLTTEAQRHGEGLAPRAED